MKKYLVIGGMGALGFHLCKKLVSQGHKVAVYDLIDEWPHSVPEKEYPKIDFLDANELPVHAPIYSERWDCVFHLAESSRNEIGLADNIIHNNVVLTSQVLMHCSRLGIRCVIPLWAEHFDQENFPFFVRENNDIWQMSNVMKRDLVTLFHKGNAVNNCVYLPRIITPYENSQKHCCVVKRFYNATTKANHTVYLNDGEFGWGRNMFSDLNWFRWCMADEAVNILIKQASIRSRSNVRLDGCIVDAKVICAYVGHCFEIDSFNIMTERCDGYELPSKGNLGIVHDRRRLQEGLHEVFKFWKQIPTDFSDD